jgi:hypothetical protein
VDNVFQTFSQRHSKLIAHKKDHRLRIHTSLARVCVLDLRYLEAVKRLVTFIDLASISIAILFLFGLVVVGIREAAIFVWQAAREMHAAHNDWLGVIILFALVWTAFRWKAAHRALNESE